jgi:hypothetical protein
MPDPLEPIKPESGEILSIGCNSCETTQRRHEKIDKVDTKK